MHRGCGRAGRFSRCVYRNAPRSDTQRQRLPRSGYALPRSDKVGRCTLSFRGATEVATWESNSRFVILSEGKNPVVDDMPICHVISSECEKSVRDYFHCLVKCRDSQSCCALLGVTGAICHCEPRETRRGNLCFGRCSGSICLFVCHFERSEESGCGRYAHLPCHSERM